ncbi:DUF4279 domain-containing protein [Deinococcus sp. NW-56]|uniref:DUF4279 domain-containing protein n=1 Tax=Deinococcus sp. NW-56 TaxID=2080419 RepID=UPI00131A141A|nr:DUF4279 domain-containing protein [Deinococcus sp. NW-56]
MSTLSIKFVASGEFNVKDFTSIAGVSPTRCIEKGERFSNKIPRISEKNRWEYSLPRDGSDMDLDQQVAKLTSVFTPNEKAIARFKEECDITYTVLCYFDKSKDSPMPSVFLTSETLSSLSRLRFDIDVDIIEN